MHTYIGSSTVRVDANIYICMCDLAVFIIYTVVFSDGGSTFF